jgi:hypothetical protein
MKALVLGSPEEIEALRRVLSRIKSNFEDEVRDPSRCTRNTQ